MRLPSTVALAFSLAAVPAVPLEAHPGGLNSQAVITTERRAAIIAMAATCFLHRGLRALF